MKNMILLVLITIVSYGIAGAQPLNVQINIDSQPAWGPVGYDYVDYYYIPDIDVYYNVPRHLFHYWDRGRWVSSRYLPYAYRRYDLYRMYKVVVYDQDPWLRNRYHQNHYIDYKGRYDQVMIYKSNDYRYRDSRKNRYQWHENRNGRSKQESRSDRRTKSSWQRNTEQKKNRVRNEDDGLRVRSVSPRSDNETRSRSQRTNRRAVRSATVGTN